MTSGRRKRSTGRSYQEDYLPLIEECRHLVKEEKCLPIELEAYWRWVEGAKRAHDGELPGVVNPNAAHP